jgi:CubicO group peptidase (beta-lactamase class C family)
VAWEAFGSFTYEPESPAASRETLFDLASLTKVVATTAMAMLLYQQGILDLDAPVAGTLPEFATHDPRKKQITARMLLAHSSGLPAYLRLFESARDRNQLLQAALQAPLAAQPGQRAEYSDIGFIILGELLARLADEPLEIFCVREIFAPFEMTTTCFNPPAALRKLIPPTADDREFRRRIVQGEVNDENASVLGGVAGHAGVFSSARDVARFAHCMVSAGAPLFRPDTVALFTSRQMLPPGTSRALGWDTPSSPSQSGKYFSSSSYGHLGYTGTSLWIDPDRQLSVTLLTNRTWPNASSNAIKQARPAFHDAVIEAMDKSSELSTEK